MTKPVWLTKVRMSDPSTGPEVFTDNDIEVLRAGWERIVKKKSDEPRRLFEASIDNGVLLGSFVTSTEPSPDECSELKRLTYIVLLARRPRDFKCEASHLSQIPG